MVGGAYAGFWRRFVAYSIDVAILWVATWLLMPSGILEIYTNPEALKSGASMDLMEMAFKAARVGAYCQTVWLLYFVLTAISPLRATIGKTLLDVAIVDKSGIRIGLARSICREIAKIPSAAILMIGYIMAAFTEQKRALHDYLSGTLAVRSSDWPDETRGRFAVFLGAGNLVAAVLLVCALGFSFTATSKLNLDYEYTDEDSGMTMSLRQFFTLQQAAKEGHVTDEQLAMMGVTREEFQEAMDGHEIEGMTTRRVEVEPAPRVKDYSGLDALISTAEKYTVSKQAFPKHFSELNMSTGELSDAGIKNVVVGSSGVLRISFDSESGFGPASLVMAPYVSNEGEIQWICQSPELRASSFPESCEE